MSGESNVIESDDELEFILTAAFSCNVCSRFNIGTLVLDLLDSDDAVEPDNFENETDFHKAIFANNVHSIDWLPRPIRQTTLTFTPRHIRRDALEACTCLGYDLCEASILMCRRIVEATAKDKGIKVKGIESKINKMIDNGIISRFTGEQATEIRHFGNMSAHADHRSTASFAEADEVCTLMLEILHQVYEAPEMLKQVRSARLRKKNSSS